jgi:photosystem II stability/assembly factor-like uncharacterized protein
MASVGLRAETIPLYDFEDQKPLNGVWWGVTETVVPNPLPSVNTSSYCSKMVISGYGVDGFSNTHDLSKYVVAVDVYSTSAQPVKCFNQVLNKDLYQNSRSNRWTTLYFDFSGEANASAPGKIFFGGCNGGAGTLYLDNIRLVTPDQMPTISKKMDVDYSYGRLTIGGGGFVSGLISVPTTGLKYARTDVGGAYKWEPADCSWHQLFDFVTPGDKGLLSVDGIAADPNDANSLYCLCGCEYFSDQKTAVLYSHDGGKTFGQAVLTNLPFFVHGNGAGRNNGERIAVDPNNGSILFAGSRVGTPLVMSADSGKTWTIVKSFPDVYTSTVKYPGWSATTYPTTPNSNGISSIVFDGTRKLDNGSTARIFVGVSRSGASNVYVSEDGGATWAPVQAVPTTYMPVRMKMDPNGNLLLVCDDASVNASKGAIYRYNPDTKVLADITPNNAPALGDVVVSPKDANKLVASTNNTWVNQTWQNGQRCNGDIIYTSKDGGATWRSLQNNMTLVDRGVTWVPGNALHWCGSMCFDPWDDNKVSFTSGNGIFTCANIWCAGTPIFFFDVNGFEETVPLDLVSLPGGNPQSAIGDVTGFNHLSLTEFPPMHLPGSGSNQGIAYAAGNIKVMARVAGKCYYTEDGGNTWTLMAGIANANKVAITADASTIVVVANGALKYSTDKGQNFTACTCASTAIGYVAADPVNPKYVYAATNGAIYVSSDGGQTFPTSVAIVNNGRTRLCVVPDHEGLIYAPCGNEGLLRSIDHGATYTIVGDVVSCEAIGSGMGTKDSPYALYMYGSTETREGLLRSDDEGNTWQKVNDERYQFGGIGNGDFIIGDQNHYGRFYMATVGMGIVYGDLAANYEAPVWQCYTDDSPCGGTGVQTVAATIGNSVSVTPNPFASTFAMDASGDYMVLNVLGSVIERGHYASGARMGSSWSAGIYFVRINGEVLKVVKR